MSKLQARLDRIRASFETKASPETLAVMHRATKDLEVSGAVEKALGEGATMPGFTLPNQKNESVTLSGLLARGPAVLTFFRGHW